jgi:hypothetical protein
LGAFEKICSPICERWEYEPIVGYSELLSPSGWASDVDRNISWSRITVSIPSSYYEIHKEGEKTSMYEKLWNLGGCLGLYAGLSMITLMQVIFYGFDFYIQLKKRKAAHQEKASTKKRCKILKVKKIMITRVKVAPINETTL